MILRVNYFDRNTPIAKFASGCEQSQLRYRDYMYYDRAYNDGYGPKWEAKEEPSFWDKLFKK